MSDFLKTGIPHKLSEHLDVSIDYDNLQNGQVLIWDDTKKKFTNSSFVSGGGATTFLALLDTPNTYTGYANKYLKVSSDETSIIFDDLDIKTSNGTATNIIYDTTYGLKVDVLYDDNTIKIDENNKLYVDTNVVKTLPAGNNQQIQYNDNGSFGASPNLLWNNSDNSLNVYGSLFIKNNTTDNYAIASFNSDGDIVFGDLNQKASITGYVGSDTSYALKFFTLSRQVTIDANGRLGLGNLDTNYTLTVDNAKLKSDTLELNGTSGQTLLWNATAGSWDRGFYIKQTDPNIGEERSFLFGSDGSFHLLKNVAGYANPIPKYFDFSIQQSKGFTLLSKLDETTRDNQKQDWDTNYGSSYTFPEGALLYNTTSHKYEFWNGSKWVQWNDLDIPTDKDYVVLSDGAGGLYTSTNNGYYFKYDTSNNALVIGEKDSPYQAFNLIKNNTYVALCSPNTNVGGEWLGLGFGFGGDTKTITAAIISVAYGSGSQGDIRFCMGNDTTDPIDPNDWMMRLDRFGFIYMNATTIYYNDFILQSPNANDGSYRKLFFRHGSEKKVAIYSKNTDTYSRGDLRFCINNVADFNDPDPVTDCKLYISEDGKIGFWTTSPYSQFEINSDRIRITTTFTPTSTSDTNGYVGDITWDDNYIYVKTNNGWKRASLETF